MTLLPCEIIETQSQVDAAVIWLHGLGASGHDFVPIVPELKLPPELAIRFIFPHAPAIPVTINAGMVMPAWYDISPATLAGNKDTNSDQIIASAQAVIALVEAEIAKGIDSKKIVLAGFSQGGAVVYQAALAYSKPLAGLMALSTYFATSETLVPAPANQAIPIHLFHGSVDQMVPLTRATQAQEALQNMAYIAPLTTYPMGHEVCAQEIEDISRWLQSVLA